MVHYCCAFGCKEKFVKGGPQTFHRFPKDKDKKRLWESKIRRKNFVSTGSSRICSKHFTEDCFDREKFGGTWLKSDAVPSIFDFPSYLQISENKRKLLKIRENNSPQNNNFQEGITGNDARGTTSRKRKHYLGDFDEKDMHSPSKARKVLQLAIESNLQKNSKLKALRRKSKKLEKRVASLSQVLKDMKKKSLITDTASDALELSLPGTAANLIKRGPTKEKYPPELRAFALTLQFYSSKAYNYVRKAFATSLPHPSTLRKWYQGVDGNPGFTAEELSALKAKTKDALLENKKVLCSLIIDEIAIRRHVEWDGEKFSGFVDFGTQLNDDNLPIAKEALTFMLNSINGNWKVPVGYFLIDGLNAKERANLIVQCLELVHQTGVEVISLTFDGTSVNFSTAKILGASIDELNMAPYFKHPITDKHIYVFLDACHMLKLVRNALASKGSMSDIDGNLIKWEYIVKLENFQKIEGLHAATKLRQRHVEWQRERMKVKLAAQVLSNSVADALLYLENDAKIPQFEGSKATACFLKCFNNLFDILNSRNLLSKGFKAPFKPETKTNFFQFLSYAENYIKGLKTTLNGPSLLSSNRKKGFLGFLTYIHSIQSIYRELVEQSTTLNFLLAYKFSQDHLEIFFSKIRSQGGFNNNPTVMQFKSAYKRLLCHHQIIASVNANCLQLDNTNILNVSSSNNTYVQEINNSISSDISAENDSEIYDLSNFKSLNKYVDDVVGYISGFVIKKLKSQLKCVVCISELAKNPARSNLIVKKIEEG